MRKITRALTGLATAALSVGIAGPALATTQARPPEQVSAHAAFQPGSGQSVIDWNRELITLVGTPGLQPATIHPTRSFAILQAAVYDAVVSITHVGQPYLFSVPAPRDARPDAAADQAAHDVLTSLYPAAKSSVDQRLAAELAAIPDGQGKRDGIRVGATVAQLLVGLRAGDGAAVSPPSFVAGNQPGDYRPTPPNFPAPVFTNWGSITPFLLISGEQFRPSAPPPVSSPAYASALNQVKSLGQDTSTSRTADQTTAAKFWGSAPIWNTWNEITQKLLTGQHANLQRAATVFVNLDLAVADATIALYDAKYFYRVWRPVTAIRSGNTGYNPGIPFDPNAPTWTPLAVTAADPSYPGAHSTISEAAATVLTAFFGADQPITVTSDNLPGVTRSFASLQAAADEAGLSRIFAGQHTRLDHQAGQALGQQVAVFTLYFTAGTNDEADGLLGDIVPAQS
jgi:membrane-associated phospholipid phosphatase